MLKDYETSKWNQILYVNLLSSTTSAAALALALSSSGRWGAALPCTHAAHAALHAVWRVGQLPTQRSFPVSCCLPWASRGTRCFGSDRPLLTLLLLLLDLLRAVASGSDGHRKWLLTRNSLGIWAMSSQSPIAIFAISCHCVAR